ncbi:hypothetical protein QAD02_012786 [Eretmocerus hayati]|uniref:Uncharacterized protein n=1 Tax=Eretmocerus hayati TaxID=131215 RepID=A0ACC2P396_9HYME|nr:hypothetical protein QAD02_012786 [Eretmocerus hayati]
MDIPRRLRKVGSKFINSNVMTAQEAVYHCLSLPLVQSSRQSVYVNTVPAKDRVRMLKTSKDIKKLDDDSEEIYYENIFQNYEKRNKALDDCCLAEYVTEHKITKSKPFCELYDTIEEGFQDSRRKKPKILRYRRYRLHEDPVNYYREQVLLFFPWRKEFEDIESKDCEVSINRNKDTIRKNSSRYCTIQDDELEDFEKKVRLDIIEEQEEADRLMNN